MSDNIKSWDEIFNFFGKYADLKEVDKLYMAQFKDQPIIDRSQKIEEESKPLSPELQQMKKEILSEIRREINAGIFNITSTKLTPKELEDLNTERKVFEAQLIARKKELCKNEKVNKIYFEEGIDTSEMPEIIDLSQAEVGKYIERLKDDKPTISGPYDITPKRKSQTIISEDGLCVMGIDWGGGKDKTVTTYRKDIEQAIEPNNIFNKEK